MGEPKVKQADSRILREALAHLYNRIDHAEVRRFILEQLKHFADRVRPYCTHVDVTSVPEIGLRCIDCGAEVVQN